MLFLTGANNPCKNRAYDHENRIARHCGAQRSATSCLKVRRVRADGKSLGASTPGESGRAGSQESEEVGIERNRRASASRRAASR
jgi:hypothetical protein